MFTLELPLLECVEDDSERLRIFGRVADHMEKSVSSCRDYVFKRIPLEMLLCRVGEEEVLMCPFAAKPLQPTVRISQLPMLLPCNVLKSCKPNLNVSADIGCDLRLLHVTGPHVFNSTPGGRRSQAIPSFLFFCAAVIFNAFALAGVERNWGQRPGAECFEAAGAVVGRADVLLLTLLGRIMRQHIAASSTPSRGMGRFSRCRGMRALPQATTGP